MEQVTAAYADQVVPAPELLPVLEAGDGAPVGSWPRPSWATRSTQDPSSWCIDHERTGKAVRVGIFDGHTMTPLLRVSDQPYQPAGAGGQMTILRNEPVVDVIESDPVARVAICGLSLVEARQVALAILELVELAEQEAAVRRAA